MSDPTPHATRPEPPVTRLLRHSVGVLSVLLLLSALLGLWLSIADQRWVTIGFDAVLIPAAVFGLLIWRGCFREGLALALLCIAGTAAVSGVLNDATIANYAKGLTPSTIVRVGGMEFDLIHLGLARLAIAGLVTLTAALVALLRNPRRSFTSLALGVACAVPALAIVFAWSRAPIRAHLTGIHPAVTGILALLSMVLFIGLCSAAVHLTIKAFEPEGDDEHSANGNTATA